MPTSASDWSAGCADPAHPAGGERKPDVAILPGAVDLAAPVGAGDPVPELARDLEHAQTGAENIDDELVPFERLLAKLGDQ